MEHRSNSEIITVGLVVGLLQVVIVGFYVLNKLFDQYYQINAVWFIAAVLVLFIVGYCFGGGFAKWQRLYNVQSVAELDRIKIGWVVLMFLVVPLAILFLIWSYKVCEDINFSFLTFPFSLAAFFLGISVKMIVFIDKEKKALS